MVFIVFKLPQLIKNNDYGQTYSITFKLLWLFFSVFSLLYPFHQATIWPLSQISSLILKIKRTKIAIRRILCTRQQLKRSISSKILRTWIYEILWTKLHYEYIMVCWIFPVKFLVYSGIFWPYHKKTQKFNFSHLENFFK